MTILNEPWREFERRQKRERLGRLLSRLTTFLCWVGVGLGLGIFLQYLLN